MTIKWGDPIECNGARPDWLRDDEQRIAFQDEHGDWYGDETNVPWFARELNDESPLAIRLPADHPAYVALARGFTPWSGGQSAPDDWDAAQPVLFRDRFAHTGSAWHWGHCDTPHPRDIIGYRKRVEYGAVHADGSRSGGQPPSRFVNPPNLTEAEVRALVGGYNAAHRMVEALRERGQLRSESRAERFTRETGHAVTEAVEAALNWKES